jgi:Ser/Thr protein kinase RdoA (MazF antagonist)
VWLAVASRCGWYQWAMRSHPANAAGASTPSPSTLHQVADAFRLGPVVRADVVTEGLMNRNWRVTTTLGDWAIKQVLDVDAAAARRQHRATTALARLGLPVPVPVTTGDDSVVIVGDAVYAVLPWANGTHRHGLTLTIHEAAVLGELLVHLHTALAETMPPAPHSLVAAVTDLATAHTKINRNLDLITQRPRRDEFDHYAEAQLHRRRDLLDQTADLRPTAGTPVEPCGHTHGDFQYLNLLWNRGSVSAVLDWDRLDVRPLGLEIARSATLLFGYGDERGLDLDRIAAFSTGYRQRQPIADADLADAVHRLWWERVSNDLWQLRLHYDNNDTSCDHLFTSASAVLGWWTTHRDAVTAAFTGS